MTKGQHTAIDALKDKWVEATAVSLRATRSRVKVSAAWRRSIGYISKT